MPPRIVSSEMRTLADHLTAIHQVTPARTQRAQAGVENQEPSVTAGREEHGQCRQCRSRPGQQQRQRAAVAHA